MELIEKALKERASHSFFFLINAYSEADMSVLMHGGRMVWWEASRVQTGNLMAQCLPVTLVLKSNFHGGKIIYILDKRKRPIISGLLLLLSSKQDPSEFI